MNSITNCDSSCFNHKSHIESFAVVRLNVSISPTTMVNPFNNKKKNALVLQLKSLWKTKSTE